MQCNGSSNIAADGKEIYFYRSSGMALAECMQAKTILNLQSTYHQFCCVKAITKEIVNDVALQNKLFLSKNLTNFTTCLQDFMMNVTNVIIQIKYLKN